MENTKLLTESHDIIETTWMPESSILLLLETEFLTSKSCNTLLKKINAWAYVVYICGTHM